MLAYKLAHKYFILVILILLTGCKSGGMLDESQPLTSGSLASTSENNTIPNSSQSDESLVEVVSSADTDASTPSEANEYNVQSGKFNLFPRASDGWDESGWSILTPSEDSRLIYVDTDIGSDDTAEFYAPKDIQDIYNPGLIKPYKSVESAFSDFL